MLGSIGEILPLAVGIAVSPLPMVAAVLLLMAPSARRSSAGFLIGWVGGLAVVAAVAALLARLIPESPGSAGAHPVLGAVKLVLGCLLLFLAVRQWRQRPRPGEESVLPKWLAAVDSLDAAKAAGLAFLLAGVNPKNLLLAFSAGLQLGRSDHPFVAGVVFLVIASSTVGGLIVLYRLRPELVSSWLAPAREWLVANNAVVMSGLMLVMGSVVIGKALTSF